MTLISKILKSSLFWIALYLIYALIMNIFKLESCPIKLLIGLPCPGCGMTRAILCLLKLDFKGSFRYNALWLILLFIVVVAILKKYGIFKKLYYSRVFWMVIGATILTYYILRLIYVYPNEPMDYYYFNLLNRMRGKV